MKSSVKIFGMVLAIYLAGTTILSAQYGMGRRGIYCPRLGDLTEKQRSDIAAMTEKNQTQIDELYAEMEATSDIEKRGDIAKKIQMISDSNENEILGQLTDKQKEVYNSYKNLPADRRINGGVYGNFRGRGPCGAGLGKSNMGYGRGPGRGPGGGAGYGYNRGII